MADLKIIVEFDAAYRELKASLYDENEKVREIVDSDRYEYMSRDDMASYSANLVFKLRYNKWQQFKDREFGVHCKPKEITEFLKLCDRQANIGWMVKASPYETREHKLKADEYLDGYKEWLGYPGGIWFTFDKTLGGLKWRGPVRCDGISYLSLDAFKKL